MAKGLIVILSGVSSVGKDQIREWLLEDQELRLMNSISLTNRPRRENEIDGKHYYFVDHNYFSKAVQHHKLLEFTEFNGYYYGTPLDQIEFLVSMGKHVLVSVEAQGVGQIHLRYPDSKVFFLVPQSMEMLEKQIRAKYNQDHRGIALRLSKAKMEMELANRMGTCVPLIDEKQAYQIIREEILHAFHKIKKEPAILGR